MSSSGPQYWDDIAARWVARPPHRLWREFSDRVNERWLRPHLEAAPIGRCLKTDLFDEATGTGGLHPLLARSCREVIGIDVSPVAARRARAVHPALRVAVADVRSLPITTGSLDVVVSTSTLDHLDAVDEIATALGEIRRVLGPDGRLLLTLDNLANPAVALRNRLPARWLQATGLVPYQVGPTCGPARLRAMLDEAGFEVLEIGAAVHCPRVIAVAVSRVVDRWQSPRIRAAYLRFLLAWERLGGWPTRYLTGYYTAIAARRRAS